MLYKDKKRFKYKKRFSKKGLSIIIGYVLLIVIAISLSLVVYQWLKNYLPKEEVKCPDGVSIMINDYSCNENLNNIQLEFKNNGLFSIDGVIVKILDQTEGLAIYTLGDELFEGVNLDEGLKAGAATPVSYSYEEYSGIKKIEIEPFRLMENKRVLCDSAVIRQNIEGCD